MVVETSRSGLRLVQEFLQEVMMIMMYFVYSVRSHFHLKQRDRGNVAFLDVVTPSYEIRGYMLSYNTAVLGESN